MLLREHKSALERDKLLVVERSLLKLLLINSSYCVQVPIIEMKILFGRHLSEVSGMLSDIHRYRKNGRRHASTASNRYPSQILGDFPIEIAGTTRCVSYLQTIYQEVLTSLDDLVVSENANNIEGNLNRLTAKLICSMRSTISRCVTSLRSASELHPDVKIAFTDWIWNGVPKSVMCDPRLQPEKARRIERFEPNAEIASRYHRLLVCTEIPTIEACAHNIACSPGMPLAFIVDMANQAADEANHADACLQVIRASGFDVGDFEAAYGELWHLTHDKPLDLRLALHQRVGETLGINSASWRVHFYKGMQRQDLADLEYTMLQEEIMHVATGTRWMDYLCRNDPERRAALLSDAIAIWHAEANASICGAQKYPVDRVSLRLAGYTELEIATLVESTKHRVRLQSWTPTY